MINLISDSNASSNDSTTVTADGPKNTEEESSEPETSDATEASSEPDSTTSDISGRCFSHFTKAEYRHF